MKEIKVGQKVLFKNKDFLTYNYGKGKVLAVDSTYANDIVVRFENYPYNDPVYGKHVLRTHKEWLRTWNVGDHGNVVSPRNLRGNVKTSQKRIKRDLRHDNLRLNYVYTRENRVLNRRIRSRIDVK